MCVRGIIAAFPHFPSPAHNKFCPTFTSPLAVAAGGRIIIRILSANVICHSTAPKHSTRHPHSQRATTPLLVPPQSSHSSDPTTLPPSHLLSPPAFQTTSSLLFTKTHDHGIPEHDDATSNSLPPFQTTAPSFPPH